MTDSVPQDMVTIGSGSASARRFEGKNCVVTGGASGIGRAIALRLSSEGAVVGILDFNLEGARETLDMCGPQTRGVALECDVRCEDSVTKAAEQFHQEFGDAEVLVNNSGIEILGTVEETSPETWDEIMAVNLRGPYLTSRIFLQSLFASADKNGGAAIVNNASLMGLVSSNGLAAYCASKAGLISLTRSMALDCAARNLRVNCVCPGIIHTPMLERRFALTPDRTTAYLETAKRPPVQYLGKAEDVAAAVAYLASDEARFVTGSALTIDGGVGAA